MTRFLLSWFPLLFLPAVLTRATPAAPPPYKDPARSVPERVADLLGRMTLDEKIAQLTGIQLAAADLPPVGPDFPAFLAKNIACGIGTISPWQQFAPDKDIAARNAVQRYLLEQTRLGIPALFHDEGCHGLVKPGSTSFPNPLALASTWDPELVEQAFQVVAAEMRSRGGQHALTPVLDVARDPRWGRFDETMGEDPFLNGRLGAAMVRGFQGSADGTIDGDHVMATLKHFVGHGAPEGGLNRSPVVSQPRQLHSVDIVPFAHIIRMARPAAVMPCYNELDGVPAHGNRELLQETLRRELGFTGLVVSDYGGVELLASGHHVAASAADAGVQAFNAGVQMELPAGVGFAALPAALAEGKVNRADIDAAVSAILSWKFRLGLFEHPYADVERARGIAARPGSRALARQAAIEAAVLLKNDGILPLAVGGHHTIAVIGPNAEVTRLGGYSGTPLGTVSLADGIRARVGDRARVVSAPGCALTRNDPANAYANWIVENVALTTEEENRPLLEQARTVAANADLIILALGENEALCRESWSDQHLGDATSLELSGAQLRLFDSMAATGKPIVVFLTNGRPLVLGSIQDKARAVIEGWYLGEETGSAAAALLFGDASPSGKLTVSLPGSTGQIPDYYAKKPYAGVYPYQFAPDRPAWPFGFGLSYTTFQYEKPRLAQATITSGGSTTASVVVVNTGTRPADEIVQLYVHQEVSSVTRAVKELKGFQRIHLAPGERREVSFPVGPEALALYGRNNRWSVEPGTYQILLGSSSVDLQVVTLEVK